MTKHEAIGVLMDALRFQNNYHIGNMPGRLLDRQWWNGLDAIAELLREPYQHQAIDRHIAHLDRTQGWPRLPE